MVNELISIVENAGLMGIKLPKSLMSAIDILKINQMTTIKLTRSDLLD